MTTSVTAPATGRSVDLRFEAIGVPWRITTRGPLTSDVVAAVRDRISAYDAVWSRFRADSLVSRIAEEAGSFDFPPEAAALFGLYRLLHDATGGRVNPLVGRRLEHLGYDRALSFRVAADPAAVPVWDDAVLWDGTRLTTTTPVLLDVGAAGKGQLVDLVAGVLDEAGIDDYVIDASGDLRHRGPTPSRIALEHPFDPSLAVGVVELENAAICASSPNRRRWGDGLHHILDATTGRPTSAVVATWAIAPTALEADGAATALFFASPADLAVSVGLAASVEPTADSHPFEALRILADGRFEASDTFSGDLFS